MMDLAQLNFCPVLVEMLDSRKAVGREGKVYEGLAALSTLNNLLCLRRLMMELRPTRTLEVGLSFGGSCLVFTASHRDLGRPGAGQHTALDPFQSSVWQDCGVLAVERAGLTEFLDMRHASSQLELPKFISEGESFDLVYVDGSHLFEDVFVDAYFITRLLSEGGVVAFDDSANPNVAKVLRFLRKNLREALSEVDLAPYRADGDGWGYRMGRLLGKVQLTAFKRVGNCEREWNAPFVSF
jgi:cephalosporin hydroxylase